MERLDMFLTDEQGNRIRNLVAKHEELNKSRIIRDALDEYLNKKENKDKQNGK